MEPESRDPVRDGRALREMARLANAPVSKSPPKKPNADHSGLVDLAALMADQPNWLDGALARAKASAGTTLSPPVLSPMSLAPTMTDLGDDVPRGVPRSRPLPLILASTGAGLLVAAACIFALRLNRPAPPHASALPAAAPLQAAAMAPAEAPAVPSPVEAPGATEPATPPVAAGAAQLTAAAPDQGPAAESEIASPGRHGHRARHEARAVEARVTAVAAPPAAAKEAEAAPAPPAHQAAAPPPPRGSALDAALRAAAGPVAAAPAAAPAPAPVAAKAAPPPAADGRPERPSGSAVTSALSSVLPGAKKCVAQMSDASRALVTFGSDGAVHKVDVSGPAGSDAKASGCLRAAFGHAHVPPFSASSYAAGVTVRPQ